MKAIILAAGSGQRMLPLTKDCPKCLLDIGGQTILEHQLRNIERAGIREVIIVAGAFVDKVSNFLESFKSNLDIKIVFNPFYDTSNNLMSVWFALDRLNGDFILIMSDLVFHPGMLERLLTEGEGKPVCMLLKQKESYDQDSMRVHIWDGRVAKLDKRLDISETDGISMQILRFSDKAVGDFKETIARFAKDIKNLNRFYTVALQDMINRGTPVAYIYVNDLHWQEVDEVEDLNKAILCVGRIKETVT